MNSISTTKISRRTKAHSRAKLKILSFLMSSLTAALPLNAYADRYRAISLAPQITANLGPVDLSTLEISHINNNDIIVGVARPNVGALVRKVFTMKIDGTQFRELALPHTNEPNFWYNVVDVMGINDLNQVLLSEIVAYHDSTTRAWTLLFDPATNSYTDMNVGVLISPAYVALNSLGEIAALRGAHDSIFRAQNGTISSILPDSYFTYVRDLNDLGETVGFFRSDSRASDRAFSRKRDGTVRLFPELGPQSRLNAVNASGQYVGTQYASYQFTPSLPASTEDRAVVVKDGQPIQVANLRGSLQAQSSALMCRSDAADINGQGVVVGWQLLTEGAPSSACQSEHAFVWSEALGSRDLNELAPHRPANSILREAIRINDRGTILAYASDGFYALQLLGDMNGDGVVNNFDIDPFSLAITNRSSYVSRFGAELLARADIDQDGTVTNFDIDPFVSLLVEGPAQPNIGATVDLGPDITVNQFETVELQARVTDVDGPPAHRRGLGDAAYDFSMNVISGPGTPFMGGPAGRVTRMEFLQPGTYTMAMWLYDGDYPAYDTINVTVNPVANQPQNHAPVISFNGVDPEALFMEVMLPAGSSTVEVPLSAVVTDDGLPGNLLTYEWRELSGGAEFASTWNTPSTSVTFHDAQPGQGRFVQLTVSDGILSTTGQFIIWFVQGNSFTIGSGGTEHMPPGTTGVQEMSRTINQSPAENPRRLHAKRRSAAAKHRSQSRARRHRR